MKGTFKAGMKYISNIFVVKEEETIEIGLPTDVKHVAHIGFDGQSAATAPTWMKEFKTGPDFASSSIGNTSCKPSSQENGSNPTKKRRKKTKAMSSSSSNASSAATSSRAAAKSKAKLGEDNNSTPADIQVI